MNGLLLPAALLLWMPAAFLLSNMVLYRIPPLRRIAEQYVTEAKRPGYAEAQKQLLIVLFVFALIFGPLIVLGFVL
jgi:hypothetical protein